MRRKRAKSKYVRTTISLPESLWKELRIESIEKRITMGELIARKIEELKELQKKLSVIDSDTLK